MTSFIYIGQDQLKNWLRPIGELVATDLQIGRNQSIYRS